MSNQELPQKPCNRGGKPVRLIKTNFGCQAFKAKAFEPHKKSSEIASEMTDGVFSLIAEIFSGSRG
jgi:hypothetical protein